MRGRFALIIESIANGSKRFLGLFSLPTVAALAGTALSVWGLWMVYPPLALIIPGALSLGFGMWLAGIDVRRKRGEG